MCLNSVRVAILNSCDWCLVFTIDICMFEKKNQNFKVELNFRQLVYTYFCEAYKPNNKNHYEIVDTMYKE